MLNVPPLMKKLLALESTTFAPLFNVRSSRGWPPAKVKVAPAATVVVPVPPRIPLVQLSVPLPGTLRVADPLTVPPLRLKLATLIAFELKLAVPAVTVSVLPTLVTLPLKVLVPPLIVVVPVTL